jgi:hypothetical protein
MSLDWPGVCLSFPYLHQTRRSMAGGGDDVTRTLRNARLMSSQRRYCLCHSARWRNRRRTMCQPRVCRRGSFVRCHYVVTRVRVVGLRRFVYRLDWASRSPASDNLTLKHTR